MERTEEEKIVQAPVVVTLGGLEYQIRPLVIKESREWRKKLAQVFNKLPKYLKVTTDDMEGFSRALGAMLVDMPDAVAELFFSYAKELPREEIESRATDDELATAFQEVMQIAFPLVRTLRKTLTGIPKPQ